MSFHSLEKIGRGDYGFIKNFADNLDTCREQATVYKEARRRGRTAVLRRPGADRPTDLRAR